MYLTYPRLMQNSLHPDYPFLTANKKLGKMISSLYRFALKLTRSNDSGTPSVSDTGSDHHAIYTKLFVLSVATGLTALRSSEKQGREVHLI